MSLQTFVPPRKPDAGGTSKPKLDLLKAQFGDGYAQVTANGINHITDTFKFTWTNLRNQEADLIMSFMRDHGGHIPFLYTPPDETTPRRFRCEKFQKTFGAADRRNVTIELIEDHGLASWPAP